MGREVKLVTPSTLRSLASVARGRLCLGSYGRGRDARGTVQVVSGKTFKKYYN
jgi:hypothetical protein